MKKWIGSLLMVGLLSSVVVAVPYLETFDEYDDGTVLASRGPEAETFTSIDGFGYSILDGYDPQNSLVVKSGRMTNGPTKKRVRGYRYGQNDDIVNAVTEYVGCVDYKVVIKFQARWCSASSNYFYGFELGKVTDSYNINSAKAFRIQHNTYDAILTLADGTIINAAGNEFNYHTSWTDWVIEIDPVANGGDGAISVKWKKVYDSTWIVLPEYQDVNMMLTSNALIDDPSEWTDYIFDIGAGPTAYNAFNYIEIYSEANPAASPTFSPGSPYISGPTAISINSDLAGASIYYTLDGSTPTTGSLSYNGPVTVNDGETLQAIAVAVGYSASAVTSLTFEVPTEYNNPVEISEGSATIDGDLSDWSGAVWAPLNVASDVATTETALNTDVPEAYYAARWQANKVYVAVKVRDTAHYFTDTYTGWNARDAVEIFLHTDNNGLPNYSGDNAVAQQYVVGVKTDTNSVWATVGASGAHDLSTTPAIGAAAGYANGEWLQYEIEMTPYTYFGLLADGDVSTSVVSNLFAGQVIGVDVDVISNNAGTHNGKKSENSMQPKWSDWANIGLHKLIASAAIPGDANGDGLVDVGDLGILAANYGGTNKTWAEGDFNDDGLVDVGDLGILAANYGTGTSGADWDADYAKVFGGLAESDEDANSTLCSALGLPLIAGLVLMGLMLVKLEE